MGAGPCSQAAEGSHLCQKFLACSCEEWGTGGESGAKPGPSQTQQLLHSVLTVV